MTRDPSTSRSDAASFARAKGSAGGARRRLGIMGGTFDPIHFGHLVTAEEARARFELDSVIFMVAGQPALKQDQHVTGAEHRYLMTVLATASNPAFDVSRLEIDRHALTYTIDTIRTMCEEVGDDTDLFFITGADAVWEIVSWKDAQDLANMVTFIGATRPGYDLEDARRQHEEAATGFDIRYMEVTALSISSTEIRRRVAAGDPIRYLTPDSVVGYIAKHDLYGGCA